MDSENRPKRFRMGLLTQVLIAIVLGIGLGTWLPLWAVRVFVTFNSVFSSFLNFLIPLIIVGLVIPVCPQPHPCHQGRPRQDRHAPEINLHFC